MDLKSGCPYYLVKNGLYQNFETLQGDHVSEIIVLGGGISGALVAYELARNGMSCSIIDKRSIGMGSTCASTSLLQYEIDNPLHKLEKQIGNANAIDAYKLCSVAIDKIKQIADDIGFDKFEYCESLYFAHSRRMKNYLKDEFKSRQQAGFDVTFLGEKEVQEKYGFHSKGAILSAKAAKLDAYLFTKCLYTYIRSKGVRVFENTCVKEIQQTDTGIKLTTDKDYIVATGKIIYSTGYESVTHMDEKIVKLRSTYACVSEKIIGLPDFFKQTLFWNTDDPYLYIREDDGRLIIGGRDENYYDPEKRKRLLEKKTEGLVEDFKKLFPDIEFKIQFEWAGTFGSTKDGLPYIGQRKGEPYSYYALGYGGNGITFSAIAAELITKLIKDKTNLIPEMFSFNR